MFENLNPLDKTTAVLEIIIMLVVAFLIGVLTAWLARKKKSGEKDFEEEHEKDIDAIENANSKIEELSVNLAALQEENGALKIKLEEYKARIKQNELELKRIAELDTKVRTLEDEKKGVTEELNEQEKLNYDLKHKLKRPAPKFSSKEEAAEALGFKLAKEEEKEDLTIIKGVGPFIQEKLNELGIYTIEQISDFTIDTVIKVTEAIEYFPGRIQRDFWVEQANQILNDRVKGESEKPG